MSTEDREDTTVVRAVINDDGQYSWWWLDRELPDGWRDAGKQGTKAEVFAWIDEVWTDMRPLELQKKMEAARQAGQAS